MKRSFFVLLLLISGHSVGLGQFTGITFFGDSLSDVGNIKNSSFGLQPGRDYFEGRFSNGPVYSERLAGKLALGPLKASSDGGTNYAYGGARTSGTSFFEFGLIINDLDEQIEEFFEESQVVPSELYVVFAGSNDFILGEATNAPERANRVLSQIDQLLDAGAQNLLSINLPLLGESPDGKSNRAALNSRAAAFNDTLRSGLDAIDQDVNLFELDLSEVFAVLLEEPAAFGFTNINDEGISAENADGFLFWDGNHPTTTAHEYIAEAAFRQLQSLPAFGGDFNFDGDITATDVDLLSRQLATASGRLSFDMDQSGGLEQADVDQLLAAAMRLNGDADFDGAVGFPDFLALARGFGRSDDALRWSDGDFDSSGEVEFFDFLILSRNFGKLPAPGSVELAHVPEPSSNLLPIALIVLLLVKRWGVIHRAVASE